MAVSKTGIDFCRPHRSRSRAHASHLQLPARLHFVPSESPSSVGVSLSSPSVLPHLCRSHKSAFEKKRPRPRRSRGRHRVSRGSLDGELWPQSHTACLTGASYSKKVFYLKHYDPKVNPIFSMPDEMDAFVRAAYCGGRVECFSLFPAMGLKDLPHGCPHFVDNLDMMYTTPEPLVHALKSRELFGTLLCEVKSTPTGLLRKPLHGRKRDGMLVFEHFSEWTELPV